MLRNYIFTAMLALGVAGLPVLSHAQDYPTKPITIVVPMATGGGYDLMARYMGEYLSRQLGQPVIIDNRPGAGSEIGIAYAKDAKPDGYTFLWGGSDGVTILPAVKPSVRYKVPDDFEFVARISAFTPVVNANLPIKSMNDLVAYAKANSGRVRYGTSGVASANHLSSALLALTTGIKMIHVPYSGAGPSSTALASGEVDMSIVAPSTIRPFIESGKVRPIAVIGTERNSLYPDTPTMTEAGISGVTYVVFYGLMAPAGTPKPIIERISKEMKAIVEKPEVATWLTKTGFVPNYYMGSDEFRKVVVDELELWTRTAKEADISVR